MLLWSYQIDKIDNQISKYQEYPVISTLYKLFLLTNTFYLSKYKCILCFIKLNWNSLNTLATYKWLVECQFVHSNIA